MPGAAGHGHRLARPVPGVPRVIHGDLERRAVDEQTAPRDAARREVASGARADEDNFVVFTPEKNRLSVIRIRIRVDETATRESREVPQCDSAMCQLKRASESRHSCLQRVSRSVLSCLESRPSRRRDFAFPIRPSDDALPNALAELGVVVAHLLQDPQDIRRGAQVQLVRAFPPLEPGQTQRRSEFLFEQYAGGGVSRGVRRMRASGEVCFVSEVPTCRRW